MPFQRAVTGLSADLTKQEFSATAGPVSFHVTFPAGQHGQLELSLPDTPFTFTWHAQTLEHKSTVD
jgi:hypothetical protein